MQLVSKVIFIILAAVRLSPQVPTSPTVGPAAAVSSGNRRQPARCGSNTVWQYTAGQRERVGTLRVGFSPAMDDQAGGGPERGRLRMPTLGRWPRKLRDRPEPAEVHDVEDDVPGLEDAVVADEPGHRHTGHPPPEGSAQVDGNVAKTRQPAPPRRSAGTMSRSRRSGICREQVDQGWWWRTDPGRTSSAHPRGPSGIGRCRRRPPSRDLRPRRRRGNQRLPAAQQTMSRSRRSGICREQLDQGWWWRTDPGRTSSAHPRGPSGIGRSGPPTRAQGRRKNKHGFDGVVPFGH